MSFRNNLQYLRATRGMTQEQLAMLLGVSRQSVTKWEAEKTYPEMDKLLKMCQIFECSLDDLVQGDLTSRVLPSEGSGTEAARGHVSTPVIPAGPPTDVCGYDEHQRMMARKIPAGTSVLIAIIGAGFLIDDCLFRPFGMEDGMLFTIVTLFGVFLSLAFFIPAGMAHAAFVKAHPYIEDFYTESEKKAARTAFSRACVSGIGFIFAGICILMLAEPHYEPLALFALLWCIAVGVWFIMRYAMLFNRTNVAQYNKEAADELELEDIVNAQVDEGLRTVLLERKRQSRKIGAVCGVIMLVATIIALLMLFVPVLASPDPDNFDAVGTPTAYFWLSWVVGGILCAIASLVMSAMGEKER